MVICKQDLINFLHENPLEGIDEESAIKEVVKFFAVDGQNIEITKDVVLDCDLLDYIFYSFPHSKITILSGYDQYQIYSSFECLYDVTEVSTLAENVNYIKRKYYRDLSFDDMFSVKQAINASRKINNIVREISEARLDGKPLSPYEKFLWAYQFVTNHVYKEEGKNKSPAISRNLISVLNSDNIVCVGFASMLCTILKRLDIPCTYQTQITYDSNTQIFCNHATCAVRIDDEKYNKHGIYHSDPTADAATVKRPTYGLTSFENALIPYKYLEATSEKPIAIDNVIIGFTQSENFEETLNNSMETPKILAELFPEKTMGKTQNVIIKNMIENEIQNSNIQSFMEETLNSISPEIVAKDFADFALRKVNVSILVNSILLNGFYNFIPSNLSVLISYGFSFKEAVEIIKSTYTEENLRNFIETKYKDQLKNNSPTAQKHYQNEIKKVISYIPKIDNIINRFNPNSVKPADPEELIEKLAKRLVVQSVNNLFYGKNFSFNTAEIGTLLKQGFSFEDIITAIKNQTKKLNIVYIYLEENPNSLSKFASTNEKEMYFKDILPDRIYNTPYEEDFERLTSSATLFSNEEIFQAFINIYMSQGNNFEFAQKLACLTLRRTNLPEPEKTQVIIYI